MEVGGHRGVGAGLVEIATLGAVTAARRGMAAQAGGARRQVDVLRQRLHGRTGRHQIVARQHLVLAGCVLAWELVGACLSRPVDDRNRVVERTERALILVLMADEAVDVFDGQVGDLARAGVAGAAGEIGRRGRRAIGVDLFPLARGVGDVWHIGRFTLPLDVDRV